MSKDLSKTRQRIEKLKKLISRHRYLYHVLDKEEISPAILDSLKHELYQLEKQHPELITLDSPTQRVGGEPLKEFKKVKHEIPMLSIEDIFSEKELYEWKQYLEKLAPSDKIDFFCELKIDGLAVTLIYRKGVLIKGATRGDGKIGEDITQNLKTIESIPLKIETDKIPEIFEIRGEVYIEKKEFEEFNQQRMIKQEKPYSNPRNLAAGSIRQLDPKLAASRPLKFLAYDIVTDLDFDRHSQEHDLLPSLGFKPNPGQRCKDLEEIIAYWKKIAQERQKIPFLIDGIVINIDKNEIHKKLGVVGKSARGSRAFKFSPNQATTIIKDIKVQIGRTGAITPVAVLEPIEVGGVTITRATLHNEDEIKKLGARINDTVIIERAGDVIPAVVKVLPELRDKDAKQFLMPTKCPSCNTLLVKPEKEKVWRCPNSQCQAQRKKKISHFVSKKGFNIQGMGPKIVDQLIDKGLILRRSDIFDLRESDLLVLDRFAKKSAENIIESIKKSKTINLSSFIYSLGIRYVGEETTNVLTNCFRNIKELSQANLEELKEIHDIGEVVAKSIYSWFREEQNKELIDNLLKVVDIISLPKVKNALKGKSFVFTGSLNQMTREEAQKRTRSLGGSTPSFLSKETSYLVVGDSPGSKYDKAKKLKIKIISEQEFLSILDKNPQ